MSTTLIANANTAVAVLFLSIELSMRKWKLGVLGRFERNPSVHEIDADDWSALQALIGRALQRLGWSPKTRVLACFEAGRHGHYVYRHLKSIGIDVHEWNSSSIEKSSRKEAKTDRLDARRLVLQLRRTLDEDTDPYAINVPSEAVEVARRVHRERDYWVKVRTQHQLRFESVLVVHGATLAKPKPSTQIDRIRDHAGLPLAPVVQSELKHLQEAVLLAKRHIREVESQQQTALKKAQAGESVEHAAMLEQVQQLMALCGVGIHTAWPAVFEAFGWRAFKNRRQVGSFLGLTGTPYDSGNSSREQGISKSGPPKLRAMMVELAWRWIRLQPDTELTRWFHERFGKGKGSRKRGIVALARKLAIVIWEFLRSGAVPEGVRIKAENLSIPSSRTQAHTATA